jgi:hypothetical protein
MSLQRPEHLFGSACQSYHMYCQGKSHIRKLPRLRTRIQPLRTTIWLPARLSDVRGRFARNGKRNRHLKRSSRELMFIYLHYSMSE